MKEATAMTKTTRAATMTQSKEFGFLCKYGIVIPAGLWGLSRFMP
jgi:hypothetical protein